MNKLIPLLPAMLAASIVQANSLNLPDTVVTASRVEQPRSATFAASSVISREDIERLQPQSLAQLLERIPGLSLSQTGGRGSQTSLFLRGTNANQTLILVDGQRISSASAGTASLEFLDIDQIERIEIVRGPKSAIYGSDAIGGVVQIFTRSGGQGLTPRVRIAAGSNQTFERHFGLSGGNQQTQFDLGGTLVETQGIDHTASTASDDADHDAYRNKALNASLRHAFNRNVKAGINAVTNEGQVELDLGAEEVDFTVSSLSSFVEANLTNQWTSKIEAGYAEDKRFTAGFNDATNTYRESAAWLNTIKLDEQHSVIAGLDWYKDKVRSSVDYDVADRSNKAAFAQYHFNTNRYGAELGMRHDDNQQFGNENTFNAAASYQLSEAQRLILSYAEGFRAPTFNDLYYPAFVDPAFPDFSSFPNPDLQPERSKTYEAQWRGESELMQWNLSAFRTDVEDLILFVGTRPENLNNARINGLELELNSSYADWDYALGATLLDPRDRGTGDVLPRRPKRSLSLDIDRALSGAVSVGAGWQLNSSRYEPNGDEWLAGYGTVELRGAWQQSNDLRWGLKLSNVLDRDYVRANDFGGNAYREEGRTAMLSLSWSPKL